MCVAQGFKLRYLGPYADRLLRLAADATLREELTAFPLSSTADNPVQPEHRPGAHPFSFLWLPDVSITSSLLVPTILLLMWSGGGNSRLSTVASGDVSAHCQ